MSAHAGRRHGDFTSSAQRCKLDHVASCAASLAAGLPLCGVCACVCERERKRGRGREREGERVHMRACPLIAHVPIGVLCLDNKTCLEKAGQSKPTPCWARLNSIGERKHATQALNTPPSEHGDFHRYSFVFNAVNQRRVVALWQWLVMHSVGDHEIARQWRAAKAEPKEDIEGEQTGLVQEVIRLN